MSPTHVTPDTFEAEVRSSTIPVLVVRDRDHEPELHHAGQPHGPAPAR